MGGKYKRRGGKERKRNRRIIKIERNQGRVCKGKTVDKERVKEESET